MLSPARGACLVSPRWLQSWKRRARAADARGVCARGPPGLYLYPVLGVCLAPSRRGGTCPAPRAAQAACKFSWRFIDSQRAVRCSEVASPAHCVPAVLAEPVSFRHAVGLG